MWKKRILICMLQLFVTVAYADEENPYPNGDMGDGNYSNAATMPSSNQNYGATTTPSNSNPNSNVNYGTSSPSANSNYGTTVTPQAQASQSDVSPDDTQSMQNLANFLAQNPGVAQQVAQILNGKNNNAAAAAAGTSTQDGSDTGQAASTPSSTTGTPWESADQTTKDARNDAFNTIANQAFPLTPDQIQTLNNMLDATQRAQAAAPNESPPQPTSTSLMVSLSPGSTPPVIRLSRGFVSSLVFIDSTGASWPIESYDIGNPNAFNITWDKKSNTLMVQARSAYTYGNLAVKLAMLNTPVMLTLVPGQKVVDYRVDLRIEGLGPNAQPGMQGSGLPDQADPVLLNVLDGVPPDGAKRLSVSSNVVQVWVVGRNTMYVRTAFTLLSPAWLSKMSSADGMNAYQLQVTPMLLLSRYGKVLQIKVEGL
jgi:intracellular multiplication protein IcmK